MKYGNSATKNWFQDHIITTIEKEGGFKYMLDVARIPIPIRLLKTILGPFFFRILKNKQEVKPFPKRLFQDFTNKLKLVDGVELKQFDSVVLAKLGTVLDKLANIDDPKSNKKIATSTMVLMGIKLLKSSKISFKVSGIEALGKLMSTFEFQEFARNLTEQKFIDTVFCSNSHEEIIRRSKDLVLCIAKSSNFLPEHSTHIWNCCLDKNEDISKASFEILKTILLELRSNKKIFIDLKKKINNVKPKEYTEQFVNFFGQYMEQVFKVKRNEEEDEYDPSKFWEIIFDDPVNSKIKETAVDCYVKLLNTDIIIKKEKIEFLAFNMSDGVNMARTLQLLLKMDFVGHYIQCYSLYQAIENLEQLIKEHNFVESTITSCIKYHKEVSEKIRALPDKKDIMNFTPSESEMPFGVQAKLYLDFLQAITTLSDKISLGKSQKDTIWGIYFRDQLCPEHSDMLWLTLMKKGSEKVFGLFRSNKEIAEFYKVYFANPESFLIRKININGFHCFRKYFELANEEAKRERGYKKTSDGVPDVDMLLRIVLETENFYVQREATTFFVDLYYDAISSSRENAEVIIQGFLLKILTREYRKPSEYKAAFGLINAFNLKTDEKEFEKNTDLSSFEAPPVYNLNLVLPDTDEVFQMPISKNLTTADLIRKISIFLQQPKERIRLERRGDVTNETLKELDCNNVIIKCVDHERIEIKIKKPLLLPKQSPRYILANSLGLFEEVLRILHNPKSEVVTEVWKLLVQLPRSEDYEKRIRSLEIKGSTKEWLSCNSCKDFNEYGKILYSLHTIKNIMDDEIIAPEYKEKLRAKKCLEFVATIFMEFINKGKLKVIIKSLTYCLVIMEKLWNEEDALRSIPGEESQIKMLESVRSLINTVFESQQSKELAILDADEERTLLNCCVDTTIRLISLNKSKLHKIVISETYFQKLEPGLFSQVDATRGSIQRLLWAIYRLLRNEKEEKEGKTLFIQLIVSTYLAKVKDYKETSKNCFDLLNMIIQESDDADLKVLYEESFLKKIVKEIMEMLLKEAKVMSSNYALGGMMEILAALVTKKGKADVPMLDKLFNVLVGFLFGSSDSQEETQNAIQNICANEEMCSKAFCLLNAVTKRLNRQKELISRLAPLHKKSNWRTEKLVDWQISPIPLKQNVRGYVGLINMGATCYVNAIVQQLYMLPEFKSKLLSFDKEGPENSVLAQLQKTFAILNEKQFGNYKCEGFYKAMNVDPIVQKDASEFLITLLDNLQESLNKTSLSNLINDIFEIKTSTEIQCSECKHKSINSERLLILGLDVKNKNSLADGIKSLTKTEKLQGDNMYHCANCEKKVCAERQEMIKSLPNILLVQLKRFEQSFTEDNRKLNSYYSFPLDLDLEEYVQNGQKIGDNESKVYYQYKLRGAVIHSGTLNAGHYYSLINDRDIIPENKKEFWLKFNDNVVENFNVEDLEREAFGSHDELASIEDDFVENINPGNAYILVYERKVIMSPQELLRFEQGSFLLKEISPKVAANNAKQGTLSASVMKKLIEEKEEILTRQLLFSPHYNKFIVTLLTSCEVPEFKEVQKFKVMPKPQEFAFKYFLTTLLRCETRNAKASYQSLRELTKYLKMCCNKNKAIAWNVLQAFSIPGILREFLIDCPKADARKCVAEIVISSMVLIYETDKDAVIKDLTSEIQPPSDEDLPEEHPVQISPLVYMINAFLQQLDQLNPNYFGQFFEVLAAFSRLSNHATNYLLKNAMVGAMLEFLGVIKEETWKTYAAKSVHLEWKSDAFIEKSKDCYLSLGEHVIERYANAQIPHVIGCLVELLRPFAEDCKDIDKEATGIKEVVKIVEDSSFNALIKKSIASRSVLNNVARLFLVLSSMNKGAYSNKIFGVLVKKVVNCDVPELPLYLTIVAEILTTKNDEIFMELFAKIVKEISQELSKNYIDSEYMPNVYLIDFIIKLCRVNDKCLAEFCYDSKNDQVKKLIERALKWLSDYKIPSDTKKVFRNSYKEIPKDSEGQISRLSKQANLKRTEILSSVQKSSVKDVKLGNVSEEIDDLDCSTIEVNSAYDIYMYIYDNDNEIVQRAKDGQRE